jgi:hypothetical protein
MDCVSFHLKAVALNGVLAMAMTVCTDRAAYAGTFDGNWNVAISCAATSDGAKPFNWRFPATVQNGVIHGQYNALGETPSGTLSGKITDSGDGSLEMVGIAGDSVYTVGRIGGVHFSYSVKAHFDGGSGSGERQERRSCSLSFSRS